MAFGSVSVALIPQLVSQIWPESSRMNWIYALPLGAVVMKLILVPMLMAISNFRIPTVLAT